MTHQPSISWRERIKSPLAVHLGVAGTLLVLMTGLTVTAVVEWAGSSSSGSSALAGKQIQAKVLEMETVPFHGLDRQVEAARAEMISFYSSRIPANYSSIATRVDQIGVTSGVRLSRVQYSQGKPGTDLTEISMDAGISGDYPQIMRFVNGLERDNTFFVIRAMSLAGQQGGQVNLRLRVSTWMRNADATMSGIPLTGTNSQTALPAILGKEGE